MVNGRCVPDHVAYLSVGRYRGDDARLRRLRKPCCEILQRLTGQLFHGLDATSMQGFGNLVVDPLDVHQCRPVAPCSDGRKGHVEIQRAIQLLGRDAQ